MTIEVVMRRPQPSEYGSVQALIETVANETFKDLFAPNPVPLKFEDEDWPLAWVAVSEEKIVGVIITNQEWVGDLWVFREHRRQGVGSRLLAQGEAEIAARGHRRAAFASFGRMRLPCNSISVRGGRLRVSSRTKSITMPCWRWLNLCQSSVKALSERIGGQPKVIQRPPSLSIGEKSPLRSKCSRTGLVCLVPDPSCMALLGWLFRITKWACQGKLAGFHIATQF